MGAQHKMKREVMQMGQRSDMLMEMEMCDDMAEMQRMPSAPMMAAGASAPINQKKKKAKTTTIVGG